MTDDLRGSRSKSLYNGLRGCYDTGVQLWNLLVPQRLFLSGEGSPTARRPRPKSSARYDLAVVVSRPVSIFLRVLTGFFMGPASWIRARKSKQESGW